ncbi:MAG: thymidine phosphorylase, partial [Deltaproteobacteria bacterium]|nr:thymidine phosphorylase [Deltaproteobacteria bacterium]
MAARKGTRAGGGARRPRNAVAHVRSIAEIIAHKRDGGELDAREIRRFVEGFSSADPHARTVDDAQVGAFAMAVVLRGMTDRETVALTMAMLESGKSVDLSHIAARKVDKHSTGGVGDKVSLCLAPLVAACGVPVPMVSGRGLGHTGGTLDKLEAIPGFRVDLTEAAFRKQMADIGCALIGQTAEIAPADRRLYAIRDVTATVESIPLITASILSKKLAEGIDALVLDVKVGRGAFMKTPKDARRLAESLVRVGKLAGKKVVALLTRMDAPMGLTIGNALETAESFEVLRGGGPYDLVECTMSLGAEMLVLGGVARTAAKARAQLEHARESGLGVAKMEQIIAAQGGDPRVVREPDLLPRAPAYVPVISDRTGYVSGVDALELGLAAVSMGAGRMRAG